MSVNQKAILEMETELYLLEHSKPRDEKKIHALKLMIDLVDDKRGRYHLKDDNELENNSH